MMTKILKIFLTWRLIIFLPLIFLNCSPPLVRNGFEYTSIFGWTSPNFPLNSNFIYPWANFDGVRYLAIAGRGYISEAAFFPLYPLLVRIFSLIFGNGETFGSLQFVVALFVSNISFFLGLYILNELLKLDYKMQIVEKTLFYMIIFPTSFFFGAIYSESLFFLLLVLSFYFARKGRWLASAISGAFLSATRLVGILVLPALLYELYESVGLKRIRKNKMQIFQFLLLVPLGLLSYIYFNFLKWGDKFYFLKVHGQLANSRSVDKIILFPQTVFRYIKILFTLPLNQYEWYIAFFELLIFFLVSILLYKAWRIGVRKSYLVFSILSFLVPILSGTFSALPRYVLILFPIYIANAFLKNKLVGYIYIIFSVTMLFVLLVLFSKGYFVS